MTKSALIDKSDKRRVVILGGGFGGVELARRFKTAMSRSCSSTSRISTLFTQPSLSGGHCGSELSLSCILSEDIRRSSKFLLSVWRRRCRLIHPTRSWDVHRLRELRLSRGGYRCARQLWQHGDTAKGDRLEEHR